MIKSFYLQNRILIHLLLFGIGCFIRVLMIEDSLETFILMGFACYLLGIIFPLLTMVYRGQKGSKIILHLFCSFLINGLAFFLSLMGSRSELLTVIGGFIGALLYNMTTKLIFKFPMSNKEIMVVAVLSALAFVPSQYYYWDTFMKCVGLFLWMMVNGYLAQRSYSNHF